MIEQLFLPRVADFMSDHWPSASHRRMFILGQIVVKVSAMFQLVPGNDAPDEAKAVALLYLEGMESGDADTYARHDAEATRTYNAWLARRDLH